MIDEHLIARWRQRLSAAPGVQQVAVTVRRASPTARSSGRPSPQEPRIRPVERDVPDGPRDLPPAFSSTRPDRRKPAESWGGGMEVAPDFPATLSQALCRAAELPEARELVFVQRDGSQVRQSYGGLLVEAERILAGLRAAGLQAGDKAVLQLDRNEDLLPAFWGCVLGGIVPVVAPIPPTFAQSNRLLNQFVHVAGVLEHVTVVASEALCPALASLADSLPAGTLRIASVEELRDHPPDHDHWPSHTEDPAFFSLTSGSTSMPKCVVLTHRNVLARAAGANQLCRHSTGDVVLNWLPFDHIGSLSDWHLRCVLLGCQAVYASKEYVLSQPLRWLELIEGCRVTHSWAPNFAYQLVNGLVAKAASRPWDLSHLEGLLTAGEAVSANVTQRFAELLAPCGLKPTVFRPAFGMAEMASGVTYYLGDDVTPIRVGRFKRESLGGRLQPAAADDPDGVGFVSLGPPIPGVRLRIVDADGNVIPEETAGHLQVQGEPVSQGYYRSPEANRVFHEDGWFETGDLGFLSHGELFLTGRAKESIIVNGVNYGCSEIEEVVDAVDGVEPSFSAACAVRRNGSEHEQFAVFFHTERTSDSDRIALVKQIRKHLAGHVGISPDFLLPVPKESIPKTAVGKLQRTQLSRRFEGGEFEAILHRLDLLEGSGGSPGGDSLVAYVVAESGWSTGGLQDLEIPDGSGIPTRCEIVVVDRIPEVAQQTRGHGSPPGLEEADRAQYRGAGNEIERRLTEIWKDVLNLPQVGPDDNVFELGGSSVLLLQLHSRIEETFGPRLSVVDMFKYPTIGTLARVLAAPAESASVPAAALRGRQRAEARRKRQSAVRASGVAVVGLACRFPGAANATEFWRNLAAGVESISLFTEAEVLAAGVDPKLVRDPHYVRAAPVLRQVEHFDADFFGYTAREAELLDPQQRILLECAWEAMEDAGYDLRRESGAVGVFVSGVLNTYLLNHLYPSGAHLEGDASSVMTLSSTGGFQVMIANDKDYLPTRISYKLNLRGPSVNVQTACSSSLVAIHMAAQSLLDGQCEMAFAGGASISVPQETGYLYREGLLVSPDGHCRAFDADARGTVFGNGAGLVLLKRLEDALADGDHIYAVIKGSAVNNDGGEKAGYLAPSQDGQAAVVAESLAAAGVSADSISYVETHGTGTALGDPIEIAGLTQAFRPDTDRRQFCAIGSVKTNIGHLQIASGVAGFIKAMLALSHRQLAPSLHFRTPNPRIDFASSPFYVNTKLLDWPEGDDPRRASVNSLGIGGTNVHVILEEPPEPPRPAPLTDRPKHLLALSAKTPEALRELAGRWAEVARSPAGAELGDACFTANAGRAHWPQRLAIVADAWPRMSEALREFSTGHALAGDGAAGTVGEVRPQVAFFFTGEGSHDFRMSQDLYDASPSFRHSVDRCDQVLRPMLSGSLAEVLYASEEKGQRLSVTRWAQAALFSVQYALGQLWMSWGIVPSVMAGHGLGQYAAACLAGVFSLEDALKLAMSHASHSLPAEPVADAFRQLAAGVAYSPPQIPILPMLAAAEEDDIAGPDYWCRHLLEPVQIQQGVAAAVDRGCDVFLEIGPEPALPALAQQCLGDRQHADSCVWLPSLRRGRSGWDTMLTSLAGLHVRGAAVDWEGFDRDYARRRLSLPTYPFQRKRYWIDRPSDGRPPGIPSGRVEKTRHPLLGRRVVSPALKDDVFESQVGLESLPILGDHQFCETPLLPGAFQLAMVVEAAARLEVAEGARAAFSTANDEYPSSVDSPGLGSLAGYVLEDVNFAEALATPGSVDRTVQTIIAPPGQTAGGPDSGSPMERAGRRFQLVSRPSDEAAGNSWVVHTTGRIVPAPAEAGQLPQHVREAHQRLMAQPERVVSGEEFYASMQEHQVRLGPSFQAIETAWVDRNEAVCRVRVPEALARWDRSLAHSVLLDACVQVLGGAEPYALERTRLPTAVERFRFVGRPAAESWWCYVQLAPRDPAAPGRITMDCWLFEPDGRVIATFTGLRLDEVPRDVLLEALGKEEIDWVYRTAWVPKPRPAGGSTAHSPSDGTWLILADQGGVGARLATLLQEQGGQCVVVLPGEQFQYDEDRCRLDPGRPEHFQQLLEATNSLSPGGYRGVVHLWGLDQEAGPQLPSDDLAGCAGALHLIRALSRAGSTGGLTFCLVTRGAQSAGTHPHPVSFRQSPLWGLGRTAGLEYPEMQCRRIDLDPDRGEEQAVALLEELLSDGGEPEIALRGAERYVARLQRQPIDQTAAVSIRPDATYLITGGTGGLGLQVAAWLVDQGARHLLLVSRRGASSEDAREAIERWQGQGLDVVVAAADVAQEAELAAVLAEAQRNMPPLGGIVHAAGIREDGLLQNLSPAQFDSVFRAKALGAWNLHQLTEAAPLDFFVGFSSIASVLGSPGQANYSAANAFLDGLMHHRRANNLPGLAVNWGLWKDAGMAATLSPAEQRALAERGVTPLEPAAALRVIPGLIRSGAAQLAVARIDWRRYLHESGSAAAAPLVEALIRGGDEPSEGQGEFRLSLEHAPEQDRFRLLLEYVQELIGSLLGAESAESIELDRGFRELGLDSLAVLMLRSRLQTGLGLTLSATVAFKFSTVQTLVDYLAESLGLASSPAVDQPKVEEEKKGGDPAALDQLSLTELADRLSARLAAIRRSHGET